MSDRHVLVVNEDDAFRERLSQLLPSQGVRVVLANDHNTAHDKDSETLAHLARHRPKLVFISVELPDKEGFSLFTKIQKAQHDVEVVLTTATVSKADMKRHAELHVHASAYLDKRELTDEQLAEILEARGFSPPEARHEVAVSKPNTAPDEKAAAPEAETTAVEPERREADIDPRLAQLLDPESAAIFFTIDEEASEFLRPSKTETGDVSPERLAELEDPATELDDQLAQPRRDAHSSPLSTELATLREAATIHLRDGDARVVERKLEEQQELHEREVEALKEALSEAQVRVTVTRHELEGQISELRAERTKSVQEGEASNQKALKKLEEILREEKATAIAELNDKYTQKLKQVDAGRSRMLSEVHSEHEKEIAALRQTHIEALERAAAEAQKAMRDAATKSSEGLEQSNHQRVAELAQAEQKRSADADAAEKRHQVKLEALLQKHGAEREALEKKAAAAGKANESMLDKVTAKAQDILESWEKERQRHHETRERHETDLAGLSRKFRDERTQALEAERARGELKLEELANRHNSALTKESEQARQSYANQLASLTQSKEQEIATLQASHMEALAKKDQEAQQALREAVERVKTDTDDQIEQLQKEHAQAVAALRMDYEEELATLEEVRRSAVSQQESAARTTLRSVEDERDEARVMFDGVRAEMAEMAAQHRSSVSVLEEEHKAELKDLKNRAKAQVSQLEDEKEFLASSVGKLKRQSSGELERATDAIAREKQLNRSNRERYERRVSELTSRHAEGLERVENDWMRKLEHLEKNLTERSEKAASKAERDGQAKLEKILQQHEEAIASLHEEFEMGLAASKHQVSSASGFEESYQEAVGELATVQGQLESLGRDLADAHQELEERDKVIANHTKKVTDNRETIDSLKTVIKDFSRSVDGYLQDRDDQDQTILSLKDVVAKMYRSIDARDDQS